MTIDTQARAQAALPELQTVTAVVLPEPGPEVSGLADAPAPVAEEIRRRMAEIDVHDTASVIHFGARAQTGLQDISRAMLADVKNKDVGPAGDSLRDIVSTIRGFSVDELDVRRKRSLWDRLTGRAAPFARFVAGYEQVQGQIDRITADLDAHQHALLKDIRSLDMLYERTLAFYDELGLYIAAGQEKLRELDATLIPDQERRAAAAGAAGDGGADNQGADNRGADAAGAGGALIAAQELRDLRASRDDLERRVHDLRLTRQVTMQSLPSIRLVQENDKSLVTKISSTLVNTVPLWETQLAQAVTIQRGAQAADAVRQASDLTSDLLAANARNLRDANSRIRTQTERGVFDIEAVRTANAELIATIEDSLRIADEGRARRAAAEVDLQKLETDLRQALAASRPATPAPTAPITGRTGAAAGTGR